MHLPSVGHISAKESSSDTACQRSLYHIFTYLYHDRCPPLPCTVLPVGTSPHRQKLDLALWMTMSWNVLGLFLSVRSGYLSPQKIWEIMRMGGSGSRVKGAGDVENTVSCNLQYAMPNVARISLSTQPFDTIPQSDAETEHLRIRISGCGKLDETWIRLHYSHYIYRCLSLSKEAFFEAENEECLWTSYDL